MGRKRKHGLDLPERVYFSHGAYFYRNKGEGAVKLTRNREEVETALARLTDSVTKMRSGHIVTIFATARNNAKARGIPMELTRADAEALWQRSGGKCELTGLQFNLLNEAGYRRRPMAPSIDRIDSTKGYSMEDCRLVLVALNLAMNEWGEEVYRRIARAFLKRNPGESFQQVKEFTD